MPPSNISFWSNTMIRNRLPLVFALVLSYAVFPERASAQTFQLAWYDETGTNPISLVEVAPSSSFTARVYMTQTSGTANYLGTVGMFGMSVAMDVGSASSPVRINALSDMVTNPQFDDSLPSGIQLNANDSVFSDAALTTAVLAPGSTNRIYLGSVTFQTGPTGAQTINAISGPALNVDGLGNEMTVAPDILVITVVPEPSTVLLIGAGCLGVGRFIVRRRKAAAAPALAA
jgi:hypothetical protein